jgi:hypothetical protein
MIPPKAASCRTASSDRGHAASWDRIRDVAAREDQQDTPGDPGPSTPPTPLHALLRSAALAAELLEGACAPGPGDPLRLEIVRTLARDLKGELEALAAMADEETGTARTEEVEGALRAADVANLAACTAPELLEARALKAAAAAHLAAGAARALCALAGTGDARGYHAQNVLKDVRGAAWRAQLAARQVDEFLS